MTLGLAWTGGSVVRDEFQLRFDDELNRTVVERFRLVDDAGSTIFAGFSTPHTGYRKFECTDGEHEIAFEGLVPGREQPLVLQDLARRLRGLSGQIQWLKGVRQRPTRLVADGGNRRGLMSPGGDEAAAMALASPDVLASVNEFYRCEEVGRYLRGEHAGGDLLRLFFDDPAYPNWRVELCDVGEGMGQVLPILVALAASRYTTGGPRILAVEDPDARGCQIFCV